MSNINFKTGIISTLAKPDIFLITSLHHDVGNGLIIDNNDK
jgi:hypothetical protein